MTFIYREDYYNPETERKGITDLLIKKHRNGPTADVELYFDRKNSVSLVSTRNTKIRSQTRARLSRQARKGYSGAGHMGSPGSGRYEDIADVIGFHE